MGRWFQRFVASGIHGEVSDATIRGYLRSASQLEDVWLQIDDSVDALIAQGIAPWDAYASMGYALAFVRACRTNVVFIQELLKADAAADPASAGYLPRVTYDQALALSEHVEPYMEEAIKASANPRYIPTTHTLPLELGPRIRYANQRLPLPHLQGIIGATQAMREWAAGLLAKYELALGAAKTSVPQLVTSHLEEMKNELSLGDFHLRTGIDMVGQVSQGEATNALAEKAEDFLWEAMASFFRVSQLVAFPQMPVRPPAYAPRVRGQEQPYARQPSPRLSPAIPTQPSPEVTNMLNQVTAVPPQVTRAMPTPPSPDVSDMLNQVIAVPPQVTREIPAHPSNDVSDMLNQVIVGPGATQDTSAHPSPDISDLLNEVVASPKTTQKVSAQPRTKAANALNRQPHPTKATPEDTLSEMLSDVCGEQKKHD